MQEVIIMNKKCQKYESLFIFSDKDTFEQHLNECPECAEEHKKMQRVSELIGEVKFHYKSKRRNLLRFKAACALFMLVFISTSFTLIYNNEDLTEALMYGEELSAEDLGFPVDSYGLLMVD